MEEMWKTGKRDETVPHTQLENENGFRPGETGKAGEPGEWRPRTLMAAKALD